MPAPRYFNPNIGQATQFRPGRSRNPRGRPKGDPKFRRALTRFLGCEIQLTLEQERELKDRILRWPQARGIFQRLMRDERTP